MGRAKRADDGGMVFHVLNRANARATIFGKPEDYAAFERVLSEALDRVEMRVLSYCVMPNHWHLVLWPRRDGDLPLGLAAIGRQTRRRPAASADHRPTLPRTRRTVAESRRKVAIIAEPECAAGLEYVIACVTLRADCFLSRLKPTRYPSIVTQSADHKSNSSKAASVRRGNQASGMSNSPTTWNEPNGFRASRTRAQRGTWQVVCKSWCRRGV